YVLMAARGAGPVYSKRAQLWARYFKDDYGQCAGGGAGTFCYDRDAFGADHLWGIGLLSYYEQTGNASYLTAAVNIGAQLETLWNPATTTYGCVPRNGCMHWGPRGAARQLLFATRLAQVTGDPRWTTLRDLIFNTIKNQQLEVSQRIQVYGEDI